MAIDAVTTPVVVADNKFASSTLIDPVTTIFWSIIFNLFWVSSRSISTTSSASTLIVAPPLSSIKVVPLPFIESYVSIVAANTVASTVVSLTVIVVKPAVLLNSLLPIAVPNVSRSSKLLDVIEVTFVKSTATVVNALILLRLPADTAASSDEITIE